MPDCPTIVATSPHISPERPRIELVLASASPRRKELLANTGIEFSVFPAATDEARHPGEPVLDYVTRMAREKAEAVAAILQGSAPGDDVVPAVLAADTIVYSDNRIFGKPANEDDALAMWRNLSGRTHEVLTSLALCYRDRLFEDQSRSRVTFRKITEREMRAYWATGEPQDKAGGYAIQGLGSAWILRIEGSYSGVVGLPMFELNRLLAGIGKNWL